MGPVLNFTTSLDTPLRALLCSSFNVRAERLFLWPCSEVLGFVSPRGLTCPQQHQKPPHMPFFFATLSCWLASSVAYYCVATFVGPKGKCRLSVCTATSPRSLREARASTKRETHTERCTLLSLLAQEGLLKRPAAARAFRGDDMSEFTFRVVLPTHHVLLEECA